MTDVSIIIVNYNTRLLLKQCVESVFEKTRDINFEIIVVDNASHDGSQQMLKEKFSDVILVESPENLGFGRANNLGAKYAKGKYLFLLNSDTILINNAVKILAEFMNNTPKAGICGGNLFDENSEPAYSYSMFLPSIIRELNRFMFNIFGKLLYGKNTEFNHTQDIINVGYITGADLMIRTDLFSHLNGFDPDFFMYYEETELTYRVKNLKYKVCNIPQSKIIHLAGKSFSNNENKIKLFLYSRKLYYQKTHTHLTRYICNCIFLFTVLSRLSMFFITGNIKMTNYYKNQLIYFFNI